MQSWAERQAQLELSNPMSPYFIGQPSVPEQIRGFMNGTRYRSYGGYINTNYFGKAAKGMLATPQTDSVDIMGVVKERKRNNTIIGLVGTGIALTVAGFLIRKIPGSQYIAKGAWAGLKGVGTGIGYMLKGIGWIFKK